MLQMAKYLCQTCTDFNSKVLIQHPKATVITWLAKLDIACAKGATFLRISVSPWYN
jgi:hypothetical protein